MNQGSTKSQPADHFKLSELKWEMDGQNRFILIVDIVDNHLLWKLKLIENGVTMYIKLTTPTHTPAGARAGSFMGITPSMGEYRGSARESHLPWDCGRIQGITAQGIRTLDLPLWYHVENHLL